MADNDRVPALPSLADADWLARDSAQAVFRALAAGGHEARAVGGAVRNALLRRPVVDVDIATTATPAEIMRCCEAAGLKCIPTGIEHGTVTVISAHAPYQVTTLREDIETFGRHATVRFTQRWEADAKRRDFTMNALYCTAGGTILDPLGGYRDLEQRRVRFIGDAAERIREDYLRILRFFRFHAEYGSDAPDRDGAGACVRERAGLARLSGERVRAELLRLLIAAGACDALDAMHDFGLLAMILGAAPRPGLARSLIAREHEFGASPDAILRLSVLAVAVEEDIARLAERLRLSGAERERLLVVDHRLPGIGALSDRQARRALYAAGPERWRAEVLAGAAGSSAPAGRWIELYRLPETWTIPTFPLRGSDAAAAGIAPGPEMGRLLRAVEDWWAENDFAPDEAALRQRLAKLAISRQP